MDKEMWDIFLSIFINKNTTRFLEYITTRQAEELDEKFRSRIKGEPIDAEELDGLIQSEYLYLSDFFNPNTSLSKEVQKEFEEMLYRNYPGQTISKATVSQYIRQLHVELRKRLSQDHKILEHIFTIYWANSLKHQKGMEKKIDSLLEMQTVFMEGIKNLMQREEAGCFTHTLGQIASGKGRYLIHKVTGPDEKEYLFTVENYQEILQDILARGPRLFFYGKGGMGKTEFLRNASDLYSVGHSYLVSLGRLRYPENWAAEGLSQDGGILQQIKERYNISGSVFLQELQDENTILLLDGINECPSSASSFQAEVRSLLEYSCKVLITGRSMTNLRNLKMVEGPAFQCFALTTADPQITELQRKIGADHNRKLHDLAGIPMYYHIISELSRDEAFDFTQYINRFQIIDRLFHKAYDHGASQYLDNTSRRAYDIVVWLLFPWISYQVAYENTSWPSRLELREKIGEFLDIIQQIPENDLIEAYLRTAPDTVRDGLVCTLLRREELENLLYILEDFTPLLQIDSSRSESDLHQDIRDYGAAVYFSQCLQTLKEGCHAGMIQNAWERSMMLVLDYFSTDTIDFILCGALESQDKTRGNYGEIYSFRFRQLPNAEACPGRFLHWCEGAIQLGEKLSRQGDKSSYMEVVYSFVDACRKIVFAELDTADRIRMNKVFFKGVEFYRDNRKYDEALKIAKLVGENLQHIDDPHEKERSLVRLKYHRLRITLCKNQDDWAVRGALSAKKIIQCKAQLAALEISALQDRYLYSSSLLGFFYSYPTPFIEQLIHRPDYPRAFWFYYSNIFKNGDIYQSLQLIGVPLRGCVGLLVYGLVNIGTTGSQNFRSLDREQLTEGCPGKPQPADLNVAEQMLSVLKDVDIKMKHVYQGLIAAHRGNWKESLQQFSLEKDERLARVAVNRLVREQRVSPEQASEFGFGQDVLNSLEREIKSLRQPPTKNYGIDGWHPQHLLTQICWVDPFWK